MEYINIISKEPVMKSPLWQYFVVMAICLFLLLLGLDLVKFIKNDIIRIYALCVFIVVIGFEIIGFKVCDKYFSTPSSTYKYEATINKDKITIQQYEDFIEKYNPTIKDGIYYWEIEEIIDYATEDCEDFEEAD